MKNRFHDWVFPINALPSAQCVSEGIDRISWDAAIKSEAVLRYYERIDADLLFFFGDVTIQAEVLGARVSYCPDAMPSVAEPARCIASPKRPNDVERMRINGEVVRYMNRVFPHKHIAALTHGPFTVAGQLIGEKEILRGVIARPEEIRDLLVRITCSAQEYSRYLLDSGANLLWISDPLASLLPPDDFERFAGEFLRAVFDTSPSVAKFLHVCGDTTPVIDQMIATGADGISLDQCMNLLVVEDLFPESVQIIGNVDPEIVEMGSSQRVTAAVKDLVETAGVRTNFTLSTGCALPPATPIENIVDFVESGRRCLTEIGFHAGVLRMLGEEVHTGQEKRVPELVDHALQKGADPLILVNAGLMRAVRKASGRYESKLCYLPEMLMVTDAFYSGFKALETCVAAPKESSSPQVALGTVRGDFHEIGKDLVRIILESHNINVVDMGVDVSAEQFLEVVASQQVSVVCLSAFITSARRQLAEVIEQLRSSGFEDVSVFIGGAAANQHIATDIRAQGYGRDAIAALRLVQKALLRSAYPR